MAKKKKQNVYMTVDEIRENGFQQEYSNLDGEDISTVDDTKTYMTVDEIKKKYEEERWKEFSVDGDRGYHTVDEIRQAALDQGLVKPREIKEEKQEAQPLSPLEKAQQETKQYGNLAGMIKKTETETIPKITDEAIKNYNTSRIGREYLEKYDDSTSYADIQKDIAEVQGKREEDSSNKDAYDLALAMLKDYVNQNYDLNGTDLSQEAIKRRQEVYDYNQNEIDNINSKVEANKGDTESLNLDDEETVSKYLNHDKDAVDFFIGYRSGRITQDAANQEKYITMRNYIENAANSDSVRDLRNEVENLRAQNAAYDRTQGQSDRYALQYGDEVKNEKTDLLTGTLHTRNNVPDNFDERVENGNDRFTDMGDISQPAIKRYGGENAVEDYNNMDAHTEMLTSEEKGIYSYLLRNEGEVSANAYLDSLKDVLQKRASETTQEYIDNASGAEKAVLLAASVPMNVYGTVTGFAEDAANIAAGKDIHPYSESHSMYNIAQQTRSSVAEDIDEATNSWNVLGFSAGDAFQAAMSIPDFMLGALTPSYYAASMSMGAAQSTAKELWEEGATNEQIVAESVLSGAAEYVFEKVSLDKILDTADKSKLVKSALAGMAVEGSEEANTEIANIISDVLVRGSQSEWNKMIQSYKDQGYSDSEAQAKAFGDMAKRVGYSAIGGAIGGAGGGAGVAVEKGAGLIQNKAERNKYIASVGADVTNAGNTQALLDTADQMKDNAEVQAQAQKVRQAQTKNAEKGTESSAKALSRETGKLYAAIQDNNVQGIQNAEASEIKAAIKQAYAAETGEDVKSDTVTQAAEAIYKSEYTGEKLTRAERNLASTSQAQSAVESVRNNPDLIEQGTQKAQERAFSKYISTAQLTQKQQETKADEDVDIAEFNVHKDDGKVYTADGRKQVDIASVASIGKNDITFALKDGQTESAKALDMPTKQAVLAQSVLDVQKDMGVELTPEIADTLYKGYEQSDVKSVSAYMQDAKKVLFNGYTNNTKIDNTINLPQGLRNQLYSMGRQLAASHTQAQQQAVIGRVNGNKPRKGSVTFVDGIKRGQLDSRRRAGVDTVENLAKSLGFDVVFYRSTKNGKGRYSSEYVRKNKFTAEGQQAPSGFWRGGKMYLDINAGMNGEGLIMFTASHELVHMIREGSPEAFQELADFLVKNYAEQGVNINDLVLKEMSKSTNLTRDEAFEEVIAESCETFLRDTHLNGKAQELYKQNPSLWSRIREALKRIINSIKKAYAVARPQSEEARITNRADIETLEKAYDLWTKGIIKSAENLRNMEGEKSQNSRYTFAGREANNADVGTLEEAQQMEEKGVDSEDIRQQTGWFKGLDGLWRFELDDSQMRIKDTEPRYGKLYLHEAIDYPQLFEAYPRLESFVVSFKEMPEGERGSWDASRRTIEINNKLRQDEDALTETLIHELQHAVQRIEGFAKGASPQYWYNAFDEDNRTIAEKKEASSRRRQNENEYKETQKNDPEFVERIERIDSTINSFVYDETTQEAWDKAQEDIKNLKEEYGEKKVNHFLHVVRSRRTAESKVGRISKPFDLYQATAGEVEARDSASRRGLTAEQRKNIRPDIDREDVVFRPGDDANVKYKTREDADYMSAVENGDMETAQRMVDEAAKRAFPNTKVRYSDGDLKRVYHGRVSEFNVFERKYGNAEGNFGKGFYFTDDLNDVESNYANEEGPDLENKIARLAERLENEEVFEDYDEAEEEARRRLITSEPNTVEAYLNMTNPVYISTENKGTYLDLEYGYDEETDEYDDEPSGLLYDFVEALGENIYEYVDYDTVETIKAQILESAYYEGMYAYDLTEAIRNMEATFDIYDNEGNSYISEAIRQSFEDIGFDGIIDNAVSQKFENMRLREDTTHYIVFNSEQIKSADPVTYDDNGDVIPLSERFNESNKDIRFSLRDNVEETRDLIAVHNLTEEKLLKSLRLGGLPMPSVAVIKAENGHKGYGDISIVFPKETIDPSENRNNKLYGGDVWSPTYPSVDYEIDLKQANKIYARAREALSKPAAYKLNPVTFHPDNIADRINSYGGEQGFIDHYKNDYGMKQFYLAEQDQAVPERYIEKRNEISDEDKRFYQFLAEDIGQEAFADDWYSGKEWRLKYGDALNNARVNYARQEMGSLSSEEEENIRYALEQERPVDTVRLFRRIQDYLKNGGITVDSELDSEGLHSDIDRLVDQSKYEEWLKELFNGIEKSSGIYNGTDYYTSSGNRRSFAQTHYTETLANVVRVMKSQENGDSFFSGNGLWAIAAKNYGTIEEMKADKDRLTNLSDEERREISNRFGERFTEIASSIANDDDNEFLALDNAYGNICDAVLNTNTKSGLLRELQKYHHKATVATVDDILDLVSDVGNMPVNYFEAKPQRAINFNEVSTAVIPDNASQALRTALDNAGVKYIEYAAGNEEARTEVLNSLDDVKFQSRDDDLYFGETDDAFDIDFGEDDSVENLIAREFVTHHEDMGEVLKNIADIDIDPKRVESIINRVSREYLGSLDTEAKHTLSIEIQLALERVNNTDAQTVSDTIIDSVRRAIEKGTVSDERAEANYKELLNAFKGKKFYLTDEQINQLKEHNMTLDSFRKAMFGKMTIVKRENAKRSINGGYADAQQLSLEGMHDVLADADAVLGLRSWQWDQENYDAPYIIKEAFDGLNRLRNQPVSQVYSDQAVDDMAVAMSAKITGGIVEEKYKSKYKGKDSQQIRQALASQQKQTDDYIANLVDKLMEKHEAELAEQKKQSKQKLSELKQKERERAEKRETELKKKYQEQRDKNREGRKRTELRHKIRNLTDSLQKRLTKPKGSQYVPRQLIAQTVDVLNAVNLDTGRSVRLSEKLALLRNEYDKLKDREESYAMYDGVISNMLLGLNDTVGNTSIMDMTLSQLKQVYDTIRSMDHVIRESVKMTDTNFKHDAHQVGRDWIAEIRAVPKSHVGALSGYVQTMLSAERFFNRIAGFKKDSTSLKLFDMLNKGQLATTQYEMEFTQIFADLIQDDKIKSLYDTKNMVDIGLVDEDGNKVPITRGMMLSLYMHLQNEDNIRHVMGGGLTVPDMKDYYKGDIKKAFGKGMKSVRVGQLDYSRYSEGIKSVIEKQLTEYERGWIEAAHEFFDEASRKALNETTMKLYGFRRANVDNYFPIHTDSNYRAASFENIVRDMSLENSGFMKERVKASNPILLEDIVDVVNDQISKTAKYCGMTLPIKNFEKVYGTTTVGFDTSVQKELNKKFSASSSNTGATKYIDNLLTDLTSGRSSDDGPFAKWLGHARGFLAQSTLTLNPRVAIAQTASVVTAAPVVGYKNITKALTSQYFKVSDEEIAEITPLFWLRRQGYATIEIGDIATLRKQKHKIQSKAAKALNWINAMDSWAVRRLFVASKYYMQENYSNLDPQSDEYKQKLSEVYNKAIEKTQPNYTVLQRPDILRNPNALLKSLTMFMTQRLQNFNIIYDSVGTFNKYNADYKAGINNVTADDVKEARSTLIRSITSQVASAATIVGMKLFADFLLHSMNGYRDDDDEITAESVSLALLENFADTIFGNILFGSELYTIAKSLIKGNVYYGISLSGIDSIKDAIDAIVSLRNNGFSVESCNKVATTVCQVLGIPLRNAEKIGKAIYYWISDISSGEFMESGIERNTKQNIHRYETKLLSGDNDGAKKIVDEMLEKKKAKGKNDKDAKSDVRSDFTTEYKKRYLEALKSNNAEEIKNIRQTLYSSGLYGTLSDLDKVMQKWVAADKKEQSK